MMPLETWLAFVAASAALIIIPGPTVMLLIGYALARGRSVALIAMPGVSLGIAFSMTLAITGLGAVLATSATLFTAMKFIGAAYLVWLGIGLCRAPVPEDGATDSAIVADSKSRWRIFLHAFAVTSLNPKLIAFYVAFLPQFIDVSRPLAPQAFILAASFIGVSAILDTSFIVAAGGARFMLKTPRFIRSANRIGGSFMIGAGAAMAALRRTA